MGSDGESDQASGTSSDEVQSPTGVCLRNRVHRRISMEVRRTRTLTPRQRLGITFYVSALVFKGGDKSSFFSVWNVVHLVVSVYNDNKSHAHQLNHLSLLDVK